MNIGIVGFGQMGQFLARHLKKKHMVVATDIRNRRQEARNRGIRFVPLGEAAKADLIILAVPISAMKAAVNKLGPLLRKDAIVADICSVKVVPCQLMKSLPCHTIGTHPLFGPQSGRNDIRSLPIVICPVRTSAPALRNVTTLFEGLGLRIIMATPQEHDRSMATAHALMHVLALSLIRMRIKDQNIKISALDHALELMRIFRDDSDQLFRDVQHFNPFAKAARKRLMGELHKINSELDEV